MSAGERWIFQPRRVVYMATLIPFLAVTGVAGEATAGDSGVGVVAAAALGADAVQAGFSATRDADWQTSRPKAGATSC